LLVNGYPSDKRIETREEKAAMGLVNDAPHREKTYRIIGAAMAIHNEHGPGHREEFYHNALALKFLVEPFCLRFLDEPKLPVYDENELLIYSYRPDFIVEDSVLLELKAHHYPLNNDEVAQVLDYFAASNFDVALLINFGRPRLDWQRLFPPKHIQTLRNRMKISQVNLEK
jgi:GxxExxY protein